MVGLSFKNFDRSSPLSSFGSWSSNLDQIFDEMDKVLVPLSLNKKAKSLRQLSCDIHETESNFLISLDLPGVSKEDVKIDIAGNSLSISAERHQERTTQEAKAHRIERYYGSIQRSFTIPDGIDLDKVQANFENGVLHLALPKKIVGKTRKIEISSGKSAFLQDLKKGEIKNKESPKKP